jgi:hypothetical protein
MSKGPPEASFSLLALGCIVAASVVVAGAGTSAPSHTADSTTATLARATQALADAIAPGERSVWEHYTDPSFVYVTENNEVKSRKQGARRSQAAALGLQRLDRRAGVSVPRLRQLRCDHIHHG